MLRETQTEWQSVYSRVVSGHDADRSSPHLGSEREVVLLKGLIKPQMVLLFLLMVALPNRSHREELTQIVVLIGLNQLRREGEHQMFNLKVFDLVIHKR